VDEVMATFDALVRTGKVRAVGLSNVPAWWAATAQTVARFRGWEPVAALQLEYSLVERTLEWDHLPAALDLGMAIVPWSPLANGYLTGKYEPTRSAPPGAGSGGDDPGGGGSAGDESGRPGADHSGAAGSGADDRDAGGAGRLAPGSQWPVAADITDRQRRILAAVRTVASEVGRSPAQVALRWVAGRPGVAGTLVGATSVAQLDANLDALDVELSAAHLALLDEVSRPLPAQTPHTLYARFPPPALRRVPDVSPQL
jgi:aryl-alcohol dehydrogenase-like predicted oxidoreductase